LFQQPTGPSESNICTSWHPQLPDTLITVESRSSPIPPLTHERVRIKLGGTDVQPILPVQKHRTEETSTWT